MKKNDNINIVKITLTKREGKNIILYENRKGGKLKLTSFS